MHILLLACLCMHLNAYALLPNSIWDQETNQIAELTNRITTSIQQSLESRHADSIRRSVVVLKCGTKDATGFSVGEGFIATNHHVAQGLKDSHQNQIGLISWLRFSSLCALPTGTKIEIPQFSAQVIIDYPEYDIAILHVDNFSTPPVHLVSKSPDLKTKLASIGHGQSGLFRYVPLLYQGLTPTQALSAPSKGGQFSVRQITPVSWIIATAEANPLNTHSTLKLEPGNSGSPLFDVKTGAVLGMITSQAFHNDATGNVIPVPETWWAVNFDILNQAITAAKEALR